ncbi:hypothetical protein BDP55DRAFT_663881 [Colletotrichum godetiae]|uniref:Uncharacterized protein n=1 Tax=Colletotrichum godetiae TaxID=1209918 RepID=A0AAJ0EY34_9PEZI|nr:uncharacterized protein BDP55DRAFT_663881 [Colletotrichum godetiae]KAK1675835.1 hypothetical protein BDP55DRAFT_663881 [Colletotrichum godetiae]
MIMRRYVTLNSICYVCSGCASIVAAWLNRSDQTTYLPFCYRYSIPRCSCRRDYTIQPEHVLVCHYRCVGVFSPSIASS